VQAASSAYTLYQSFTYDKPPASSGQPDNSLQFSVGNLPGDVINGITTWLNILTAKVDTTWANQLAVALGGLGVFYRSSDASGVYGDWRKLADTHSPAFTGTPTIYGNPVAVASGTDNPYETNLPVGSYISVKGSIIRNTIIGDIYLDNNESQYTTDYVYGYDNLLSGIWRACGGTGTDTVCRRVA
jgi:hypothetical protein